MGLSDLDGGPRTAKMRRYRDVVQVLSTERPQIAKPRSRYIY
jgi:hypothetical protein